MSNLHKNADSSSTELDFTDHWSFFNIHQEVIRGQQLREEKSNVDKTENAFRHFELNLPSCSKKSNSGYLSSPHPKYRSQKLKKESTVKKSLKRKTKRKQCPLRIIELAEPLKRRCLYALQNNAHTLPDFMIERLRNYIMDEKPIVKISDAVSYFKNRKKSSKNRKSKKESFNSRNQQLLLLSSILGYRIIKKILKPANIVLSPKLENVRYIVSDDIKTLLRSKKNAKVYKNDKILTEVSKKVTMWIASVLEESSNKLLLEQLEELEEKEGPVLDLIDDLVDTIVYSLTPTELSEDSSFASKSLSLVNDLDTVYSIDKSDTVLTTTYKQETINIAPITEEQLQSEIEGKINFNTEQQKINKKMYMNDHLDISDSTSDIPNTVNIKSINEYEQPAMDDDKIYLDDELNKINISTRDHINSNDDRSIQDTLFITSVGENQEHSSIEPLTTKDKIDSVDEPQQINENISMKDHLKNLLEERIDFVVNSESNIQIDNEQKEAIGGNTNLPSNIEDNINHISLYSQERQIDDDHLLTSSVTDSINNDMNRQSDKSIEHDSIIDESLKNNFKINYFENAAREHQNLNDSENFTNEDLNYSLEENNEGNKKVKFSNSILDIQKSRSGLNMNTPHLSSHVPVVWKSSKEYILSQYNVAPPNPNLLSFIDEVWPDNILPPICKSTDSVSRSVTSLGRILEIDEMIKTENDNDSVNIKRSYSTIISTIDMTINPEINHNEKLEKSLSNFAQEIVAQNWVQMINSEKLSINYMQRLDEIHEFEENTNIEMSQNHDNVKIRSSVLSPLIPSVECKSSSNQAITELSEGNCYKASENITPINVNKTVQTTLATIINDSKISLCNNMEKWSIDLENIMKTLDLWALWIHNICLSVMHLKHEEYTGEPTKKHTNLVMWVKLNGNIDYDVQIWSHLHSRLCYQLKKQRSNYCKKKEASTMELNRKNLCKCMKDSNRKICANVLFEYYHRVNRKV